MKRFVFATALAVAAAAHSPVFADEILDAIQQALDAYEQGNRAQAKQQLDYAGVLIGQEQAQQLASFLPEALDGWEAGEAEANAAGAAVMGGGISARRTYEKDGNDVQVSIVGDSPMMQMAMMMMNPAMAAASGGQVTMIGGQQAVITADGQINFAIANRWFVTVEGSAPLDDKRAFAAGINFSGLQSFN